MALSFLSRWFPNLLPWPPPIPPASDALTVSEDGWLQGPGVVLLPSVRHSPLTTRDAHGEPAPIGVCWHWTAGVCAPGWAETLARRIQTLLPQDRKASWHVVISKQGDIFQSVAFDLGSWHCATGTVPDGRGVQHRVNRSLVGVELENAGRLRRIGDQWYVWPYWKRDRQGAWVLERGARVADPGLRVDAERATPVAGQGVFDAFPAPQVRAATRVLAALVARYELAGEHCTYLHGDFDPAKEDAGPLWRRGVLPGVLGEVFPPRQVASA